MPHPSDQELLLDAEGELSAEAAERIRTHIDSCSTCCVRRQELEGALAGFIRAYHQEMNPKIPPVDGPRTLLMAQLAVPAELQRKVFEEYGIAGAEPRAYEVDYLVTPALGGADDIRNLWPHSYSATMWNAQVKDALEDRLRDMVCERSLDLMEAQREIAVNWIAAHKKYFHTETPLEQHYKPETPN